MGHEGFPTRIHTVQSTNLPHTQLSSLWRGWKLYPDEAHPIKRETQPTPSSKEAMWQSRSCPESGTRTGFTAAQLHPCTLGLVLAPSQQVAEGYVGSALKTKGESLSALIVTCSLQCVSRKT